MALAGQLAKLLTKSAKGLMSSSEPLQHYPVLRVLTPEQEAMFAHRPESSYTEQSLLPIDQPPTDIQEITSKKTSRKQIPALFKSNLFDEPPGSRNLDLGGGRYTLGTDWLKKNKDIDNSIVDKYWKTEEENNSILKQFENDPADSITINNVLNVIKEPDIRHDLIEDSFKYLKPNKKAYFQIYEGDGKEAGSGIGRETTDGWQNYKKTIEYTEEIEEVFGKGNVEKKGKNILIAKKPSAKEVKSKKGKTREEIEIQGGSLSSKLNETQVARILDEHGIDWEYHENGGITAIEKFSKGPDKKKHFKSPTTLRTIRNWLGYNKGGVVDMRHGGRVGAAVVAASLMASGGQAMDMRDGGRVGMQGGGMTTLIPLQSGETPPIPKMNPLRVKERADAEETEVLNTPPYYPILPLGSKKNNPGNLEVYGNWAGIVGSYADQRREEGKSPFAKFSHPVMGLRALAKDFRTKIKRHKGDIEKIFKQYAPESENKTQSYINFVQSKVGKKKITEEDLESLIHSVIKFENTREDRDYYLNNPQWIQEGIELSEIDMPHDLIAIEDARDAYIKFKKEQGRPIKKPRIKSK